jgi:hypothetical protein
MVRNDPTPIAPGILSTLSDELNIRHNSVAYTLKVLEEKSLVLRTYLQGRGKFGDKVGFNPMVRLELVDPDMPLPPMPKPLPLAAVVERENRDLYERAAHEPTAEEIILALLERNEVLQGQIDKLQDIVAAQAQQLQKPKARDLTHLQSRVRDALTPEKWEELRHSD